jgi:hypothetical protein
MEVSDTITYGAPSSTLGSNCVLLNTLSTPALDPHFAVLDPASPSYDLAKKKRR